MRPGVTFHVVVLRSQVLPACYVIEGVNTDLGTAAPGCPGEENSPQSHVVTHTAAKKPPSFARHGQPGAAVPT